METELGEYMSVVEAIKKVLPPSSRSFHAFREAEENRHKEMLQELSNQVDSLLKMQLEIKEELAALQKNLKAHDSHMKFFEWESYRTANETNEEAKKRFFRSLPPASGSKRLIQRGTVKLLKAFNEICKENGLSYYAGGGTLIGAIRHNGFIPWDDDIDLVMMRDDYEKLKRCMARFPEYRISVLYDPFVLCRQIRFMFKEPGIPCFLDIFPFDYANEAEARELLFELRKELMFDLSSDVLYSEWLRRGCIDEHDLLARKISEKFDNYIAIAKDKNIISGRNNGSYLVRGLDNFDDPNGYHWSAPLSEVLPIEWVPFDETVIAIPANYKTFLEGAYGDIYDLPKDIYTHFDHIADQVSDYSVMEKQLEKKLKELG